MIELVGVSKRFGSIRALDEVNENFSQGKIFGILGPNGSGKSTLLKLITGLHLPDGGEILLEGNKPSIDSKKNVAYLPEVDYIYPWMSIKEAARFSSCFYEDWDEQKYRELLKFLRLEEDMSIKRISKGMRAKAKLLLTFSRNARFVLLDEPFSGIDIATREKIVETIIRDYTLSSREQTVLIATHEIQEIEGVLDEAVFIRNGKTVLRGDVEDLREKEGQSLTEILREVCKGAEY